MSSTILLPPCAQLCIRYCSNKQQVPGGGAESGAKIGKGRNIVDSGLCNLHRFNRVRAVVKGTLEYFNETESTNLPRHPAMQPFLPRAERPYTSSGKSKTEGTLQDTIKDAKGIRV
jgi:hypothetical protein